MAVSLENNFEKSVLRTTQDDVITRCESGATKTSDRNAKHTVHTRHHPIMLNLGTQEHGMVANWYGTPLEL